MPFVQSTTGSGTASPTTTTAFTAATTAGNLIVVAISNDSGGTTSVTGVTDNKGNTYTKIKTVANSSALDIYYAANIAGGTGHTISVTWSLAAASNLSIIAQEYSSMPTAPLDVSVSAIGSTVSPSSGATAATTQADELVVGILSFDAATTTVMAGSGYGNLTSIAVTGAHTAMESKVISATGAQTATFTLAASRAWIAAAVAFKASTAPPVTVNKGGFFAFFA